MNYSAISIFVLFFTFNACPQENSCVEIENFSIVSFIKDITLSYAIMFGTTIAHEIGHAVMTALLTKGPVHIMLGGQGIPKNVGIKKYGLHIQGYDPLTGATTCPRVLNPMADIAINVAGPLFGGLTSWFLFKKLRKKKKYYVSKTACLVSLIIT